MSETKLFIWTCQRCGARHRSDVATHCPCELELTDDELEIVVGGRWRSLPPHPPDDPAGGK